MMKLHRHKKAFAAAAAVVLSVAMIVGFFGGNGSPDKNSATVVNTTTNAAQSENGALDVRNDSSASSGAVPDVSGIQTMPANYVTPLSNRRDGGTLHEFRYKVTYKGKTYKRPAIVYLPAGYDKSKKYDIFYLMHGYGGTYHTFLGWWKGARPFKYVMDHMIYDHKIRPTIVVDVEYFPMYGEYYYDQLDTVSKEIVNNLAPAVESKYSTYATSTTEAGLAASRAHRAIGGFSMGGCATWRALKNYPDVFKYYVPMSLAMYYNPGSYVPKRSVQTSDTMANAVRTKAPGRKVYVFAASGSDDFMNQGTEMQARDLAKCRGFKWVDPSGSFRDGNVTYNCWEGRSHSFKQSFPYLYNGLIRFFGYSQSQTDEVRNADS